MSGTEPPAPKHQWRRTQIDEDDPPTDLDWIGYDGRLMIGRIRKEIDGKRKGFWMWAAWYPTTRRGSPPTPNAGYSETARLAALKVEEFWETAQRVMRPRSFNLEGRFYE